MRKNDSNFEVQDPNTGREAKGARDHGKSVDSIEEDEDNRPSARRRIK